MQLLIAWFSFLKLKLPLSQIDYPESLQVSEHFYLNIYVAVVFDQEIMAGTALTQVFVGLAQVMQSALNKNGRTLFYKKMDIFLMPYPFCQLTLFKISIKAIDIFL